MKNFRLAIVDDNELYAHVTSERIRGGVKNLLPDVDIDITTFNDPVEFVYCFKESQFDLVLMDQSMPGLKGSDVLSKLESTSLDTKFFFVTDFEDDEALEKIIKTPNVIGIYPKSKFLDENITRIIPLIHRYRQGESNHKVVIQILIALLVISILVILFTFNHYQTFK
jgi:CheY-like chemotaxis protein